MTQWNTPILHADLDAFYAAVEVLRDPRLKGKPVIVGGTSSRGVVTSASYEARRLGIRSAMPTSRARRLCPQGVFLPPDFDAYREASRRVHEIFGSFSPVVEPLGLDEAFLDLRGAHRLWKGPAAAADALKKRVYRETGLVATAGVAANKFLAKVASRRAKPDGLMVVDPDNAKNWLSELSVEELWGVGEQTAQVLRRLGLSTIADVARVPPSTLEKVLGPLGLYVCRLAAGSDDRPVVAGGLQKSLGAERTFEHDLAGETQILTELLKICDKVGSRLRLAGSSGRTIVLKIRLANFTTITRSTTLAYQVDATAEIYRAAREMAIRFLAGHEHRAQRIRLLGVSMGNLSASPGCRQLTLKGEPDWVVADRAVDRVRRRFGDGAAGFASVLR